MVVPMPTNSRAVGIDIGGSGIKGGVVDLNAGELVGERVRQETPQPATPDQVAATVGEVVRALDSPGPCGVAFPVRSSTGWRVRGSTSGRAGPVRRCAS
jgi:polyphosphate glucokinase